MYKSLIIAVLTTTALLSFSANGKGIELPRQVSENIWVMGTPDASDIAYFAEQGGDIVISLLSVQEMAGSKETEWTTNQGLAFFHVPVDGSAGVTFANARALDRVLLRHSDKTILVHCASSNRVGALFALRAGWLDGHSTDKALEIGRQHGLASLQDKVATMLEQQHR